MTTQVLKTRSSIVKAVTAAVLLAACSHSAWASTAAVNELQQESITRAQVHLVTELNTSISQATGIENVSARLAYSEKFGAEIKQDVNAALATETEISITQVANTLYASLNTAVLASTNVTIDPSVIVASVKENNVLPSISAYTAEFEQTIERTFNTMVITTLSETANPLFTQVTYGNLE